MSKPNILFVMTDHTTARALQPGNQCMTPNLDSLAGEGVRFQRCYTSNAICSPARASLMTGLYPSTHGMWDCTHTQRREWLDIPAGRFDFFSDILKDADYHNGYFGKWHVEQSNKLENFGWHDYDLSVSDAATTCDVSQRITLQSEGYSDYKIAGVGDPITSHPAFDKGLDFIDNHLEKRGEQPFCCFISTIEPHDPYVAPRQFYEQYDPSTLELSSTLRADVSNKPEVIQRINRVWKDVSASDWQKIQAAYYATISFLDHEVGRVVQHLKERGQYDNTIIVFLSDHGDMMGSHGLLTKGIGTAYEEVYNIPLIIKNVGANVGREERDALVSMVDIAPTILECCGLDKLPKAQGRSFAALLGDDHASAVDEWCDAFAEFFGQRFVYTQRITWHKEWKYIFSPCGRDELYNLKDDPEERHNLAKLPEHNDKLKEMCSRMWNKIRAIDDQSLLNSDYATVRIAPVGPQKLK